MAMLSARKSKRGDESGARLPAFVLGSENLDSYRPWLKRIREWTRKQGGRIMEAHRPTKHEYHLSQETYIDNFLSRFGYLECRVRPGQASRTHARAKEGAHPALRHPAAIPAA